VGVSEQQKDKFRNQLQQGIRENYEIVKNKVKVENDRQSKDILAEMYREKILPKSYTELQTFYKDWQDLEQAYFGKVSSKQKYELWAKFAFDKVIDGSMRIMKTHDSKKDL